MLHRAVAIMVLALVGTACGGPSPAPAATDAPIPSLGIGETPPATPESSLPTPASDAARDLVVVDSGYTWAAPYITWAVILENPNQGWFADGVSFYVTFHDSSGTVVTASGADVRLSAGQRTAVGGTERPPTAPASMVVEVDVRDWYEADRPQGEFIFDQVTTVNHEGGLSTTGVVTSSFEEEVAAPLVVAVYTNAAGEIIGGHQYPAGLGYEEGVGIGVIDSGGQLDFEIRSLAPLPVSDIAATTMYSLDMIPMEAAAN